MVTTQASGLARGGESVRRLQAEVEGLVEKARKGVTDFTGRERGRLSRLVGETRRVREELRTRAETVVRDAEKRAAGVLSGIEERVTKLVEPVTNRFRVASREEVAELRDRVDQLEKRLDDLSKTAAAA